MGRSGAWPKVKGRAWAGGVARGAGSSAPAGRVRRAFSRGRPAGSQPRGRAAESRGSWGSGAGAGRGSGTPGLRRLGRARTARGEAAPGALAPLTGAGSGPLDGSRGGDRAGGRPWSPEGIRLPTPPRGAWELPGRSPAGPVRPDVATAQDGDPQTSACRDTGTRGGRRPPPRDRCWVQGPGEDGTWPGKQVFPRSLRGSTGEGLGDRVRRRLTGRSERAEWVCSGVGLRNWCPSPRKVKPAAPPGLGDSGACWLAGRPPHCRYAARAKLGSPRNSGLVASQPWLMMLINRIVIV